MTCNKDEEIQLKYCLKRRDRENGAEKKYLRQTGQNFSKLDKRKQQQQSTDPGN